MTPRIFQGLMERLLKGILGIIPYFDDVLVVGRSSTELVGHLQEVLHHLQGSGLKVKEKNFQFGVPQIMFLGFLIDTDAIHPTACKVKAIHRALRPCAQKESQQFLRLMVIYHSFLLHKSSLAEPLQIAGEIFAWGLGPETGPGILCSEGIPLIRQCVHPL